MRALLIGDYTLSGLMFQVAVYMTEYHFEQSALARNIAADPERFERLVLYQLEKKDATHPLRDPAGPVLDR